MSRVRAPSIAHSQRGFFVEVWQSALLGIVQGITEFFPISSSAHLKLLRSLLGIEGNWLYFDLACHLGSWCALVWWMRQEISYVWTQWKQFFLALFPLVPAYLLFKYFGLSQVQNTGYFLILTALLLFFGKNPWTFRLSPNRSSFFIGSLQALALLPGLSRSGLTMVGGRICGKSWKEAAHFSFLLAIPTIFGGEVLESWKAVSHSEKIPWNLCAVGAVASLFTGLLAIRLAFRVYEKGTLAPFAWYCLALGAWMIGTYG